MPEDSNSARSGKGNHLFKSLGFCYFTYLLYGLRYLSSTSFVEKVGAEYLLGRDY